VTVPWAPDLPQCFLHAGYHEQPVDNVIRESMDTGPPKARVRATVAYVSVKAAMIMSNSQRLSFLQFYRQVLAWGTIPFALDDPDGVSRAYFIVAPPSFAKVGKSWRVDMALEYLFV
jgi:hypothetical protein